MPEFWETAFVDKQLMWGHAPTVSALLARDEFVRAGVREVLVPGVGYGRNAKPFLDAGMSVTGIEISDTAISLARSALGLTFPIHHGSVTDMPFDERRYDGVFCFGLLYLLDAPARAKVVADCFAQLSPGGRMIFTVISKRAPMFGQGACLGEDCYERVPGLSMYFYDDASVERAFGSYGMTEAREIDEPAHAGSTLPFFHVVCAKA